jgi:hypothetical protein
VLTLVPNTKARPWLAGLTTIGMPAPAP